MRKRVAGRFGSIKIQDKICLYSASLAYTTVWHSSCGVIDCAGSRYAYASLDGDIDRKGKQCVALGSRSLIGQKLVFFARRHHAAIMLLQRQATLPTQGWPRAPRGIGQISRVFSMVRDQPRVEHGSRNGSQSCAASFGSCSETARSIVN